MRELAQRAGVSLATVHQRRIRRCREPRVVRPRLGAALGMRPTLEFAERGSDRGAHVHRRGARTSCTRDGRARGANACARPRCPASSIDEPYQHYQFAGRADVARVGSTSNLLHIENRTRFQNLQEARRRVQRQAPVPRVIDRPAVSTCGPRGWRSVTHVMACLWSSEVLHSVRLRRATFEALCPDPVESLEAWLAGDRARRRRDAARSHSSIRPRRSGRVAGDRRYRGGRPSGSQVPRLRRCRRSGRRVAQRGRVTKTPQPR